MDNVRLIDANALLKHEEFFGHHPTYDNFECGCNAVRSKFIENAPTIELKMEWQHKDPFTDTYYCSNCDYAVLYAELVTPHCAWCGYKAINFETIYKESEEGD